MISQGYMPEILIVTADHEMAGAARQALEVPSSIGMVSVCSDLDYLATLAASQAPQGVLVDLDPAPERTLRKLEPVVSRSPSSRFILVCRDARPDLMPEAMQIGARHLLQKQEIPTSLRSAMQRLISGFGQTGGRGGRVITLFSASGGCGATTMAINLAQEIAAANSENALLVDMDWTYGGLATHLGLKGGFGIADLLAHPGAPDGDMVSTGSVRFGSQISVLLSPASMNFGCEPPSCENLALTLDACRSAFGCTIIDAPRVSLQVAGTLVACSQLSLVLMQPEVKDVHVARQLHEALEPWGRVGCGLETVVTRYRKRHTSLTVRECAELLGHEPFEVITSDYASARSAATLGQALSQACPRSGLCREIRGLAGRLWTHCESQRKTT